MKKKPKNKNGPSLLIAVGIVLAGMALTAYPFVSNYFYEKEQEKIILDMDNTDPEAASLEAERERAEAYNTYLLEENVILTDPFDPEAFAEKSDVAYEEILNLYGNGMMGYLEIPAIDLTLGIYHGTSPKVLEEGVGHLENSSLPVGGESTHSVLSAHTGLSDKKLFTDLILLEEGDTFYIHVLDEILAYEVDQIKVVTPEDTSDLHVIAGRDLVTLVTCTPYGVNSHRLLVRGTRIPYVPEEKAQEEKSSFWTGSPWMRQYVKAILAGLACAVFLFLAGTYIGRRRKNEKKG